MLSRAAFLRIATGTAFAAVVRPGSAPDVPLVLLHAFPLDSRMWDGVHAGLRRPVTPDQRGFGGNPWGPGPLPEPSLDVVAAEVLAQLERQGINRFVLGGCSMGGYLAMAVLRAARARVSGLLLVDTRYEADTPQQRENRYAQARRVESEGTGWLADALLPNLLGATTRAHRPHVVRRVRELIAAQPATGVAWALRAMAARPDSADTLRAVTVPALVVSGEEDTAIAPPASAEAMARLLPRGELAVLPSVGHLPPLENPALFTSTVAKWLATGCG